MSTYWGKNSKTGEKSEGQRVESCYPCSPRNKKERTEKGKELSRTEKNRMGREGESRGNSRRVETLGPEEKNRGERKVGKRVRTATGTH